MGAFLLVQLLILAVPALFLVAWIVRRLAFPPEDICPLPPPTRSQRPIIPRDTCSYTIDTNSTNGIR